MCHVIIAYFYTQICGFLHDDVLHSFLISINFLYSVTNKLRDSLILEYGSILFEHQSLWSVGLSYLAGCGTEGRRRAELLLERLPIKHEGKALRVIAEARKYGLHSVGMYILFLSKLCALEI